MNVEIGTEAVQFFSGYIRFKFSVLVLCSVVAAPRAQTMTTVYQLFWPLFSNAKIRASDATIFCITLFVF